MAVGRDSREILYRVGPAGSEIHTKSGMVQIPAANAIRVVDPTGCGDAYRAGLLYGIRRGWSWLKAAQLASVMGSIKIAHRGGQNHRAGVEEIGHRFREAFGQTL